MSTPDETATDADIETAAAIDTGDDFLAEEEINYYMSLDER